MATEAPPARQAPPSGNQHPLANYQFSKEELAVLRQCNSESFFQRSLPLGTAFGLAAYLGVKNGMLMPNARYGAGPKVVVGVVVGYFLGKFSYQRRCAEKIMKLPNSKLAEVLRQRQRGSLYDTLTTDQGLGAGLALAPFTTPNTDTYSDEAYAKRSTSFDLDTERPTPSGLDDIYRPTLDSPATTFEDNLPLEPPKQTTSYDELRKKNREEYAKKSQGRYSAPLLSEAPPVSRARQPEYDNASAQKEEKNKYGDVWRQ